MKPTAILFDLDGTLLPMDQDVFTKSYFRLLAAKMAPYGYEPKSLVDGVWSGTAAMVKNDGSRTNEEAFWECFGARMGARVQEHRHLFDEFYRADFQQARAFCGLNPLARESVALAKDLGLRVALATNPLFPRVATHSRIRWAGLEPQNFELVTTYENSRFCKPNPQYYLEIATRLGARPEQCLMVGNDVTEDMAAGETGMKVFLLTDFLINRERKNISVYPRGSFEQLMDYIGEILG